MKIMDDTGVNRYGSSKALAQNRSERRAGSNSINMYIDDGHESEQVDKGYGCNKLSHL